MADINQKFPIEGTNQVKLRVIYPIMIETQEKFNLRPRKITVNSDNVSQLNNHPELFEKVKSVVIDISEFNFDVLPTEIKRIEINEKVDEESVVLNRLKKECE